MLHLPQSGFLHWERPGNDLWWSEAAACLSAKHVKRRKLVKKGLCTKTKTKTQTLIFLYYLMGMTMKCISALLRKQLQHLLDQPRVGAHTLWQVHLRIMNMKSCWTSFLSTFATTKTHKGLLPLQLYLSQKQAAWRRLLQCNLFPI